MATAWATNVNVRAAQKGLYVGLEKMDSNAAITRDNAARMVWNALQAYEVEYKTALVADKNGKLSTQVTVSDKVDGNFKKITLLRDKYDAWTDIGTLTAVKSNVITLTMNSSDKAASDLVNDNGSVDFSKLSKDYSALIGQKVKVLFKNGKTNDVIGVYATSDNTIYKTLMNNVELDGQKIKFDGKSYSIDEATTNGKNIKVITDGNTAVNTAIDPTFKDTAANKVSMNEVTFIDSDDNGKIDTAIITTKTSAKVTYVSSTDIVAGKTYKFADDNISKDLAKDDYAVITKNLYNDNNDIVKAEVLNTKLTGYRAKTGYVQYQLDGKWYNMATADGDVTTGDTVKAYVYNGVVLDLDTDDGNGSYPSNVAVVVAKGNDGLNGDQAKIRYFDGTSPKTVTVDEDSVSLTVGNAYKVTASGSDMKFENLKTTKYNGFTFVGNQKPTDVANDKINSTKVDDSAVIILYDGNGASKQITGKQYNALTSSDVISGSYSAVFTKETNGLTRVRMASVKVPKTNVSGKSNDNYAYIISDGVENENGKTAITIWTGTENKNVVVDTGYTDGEYTKGMLIGYSTIDDKGIINDVDKIGDIDSASNFPSSGTISTSTLYKGSNKANVAKYITVNDGQLNVTADTTVLLVNSDADNNNEIGLKYTYGDKLPKASEYGDNYLINAMWVMDEAGTDDADIEVLVIDATGAFKGYKMDDVNAPSLTANKSTIKATYGTALASNNTVTLTKNNFAADDTTAIKAEYESVAGLTATVSGSTATIATTVATPAGTYTVTFKAGSASTTVKVVVAKAQVIAAATATGTITAGTRVGDLSITVHQAAPNAGYTLDTKNVKVLINGIEESANYRLQSDDKVTVKVTATADKNHTFANGATTATATATVGTVQ